MHRTCAWLLPPLLPRRGRRAARRGVTLVEIAIVTALVAVIATIAVQRLRLQLARARSSEAVQMVGGIARALTTTFAVKNNEQGTNPQAQNAGGVDPGLCRDTTMVPAQLSAVQRRKYQPENSPNRDYNTGNAKVGWKCVGFMNEQPQHYQYRYNLGLPPINPSGNGPPQGAPGVPLSRQFAISARGDVDGDNQLSWLILTGYAVGQDLTIATTVGVVNQEE